MLVKEKELKYVRPQIKGMVTIPVEFRKSLDINEDTILTVQIYRGGVFFEKLQNDNEELEIYSEKRIKEFLKEDKLDKATVKKLEKLFEIIRKV